ncbi:hypothetical protein CIRMBP1307_00303 [Enterococcus cecorum]|uniref:hypothetical protein n=1 Tax=Enterococcus cecorum TaxID=44008 RepID=UPI000A620A8F|nr:hypothetical protein [Enterococcus cecorum]CAI3333958.1 hypothetical protein CIRMBP1307_00303 [Enterococcus cecorum]
MNSLNLRQVCGGDTIKQADFGSELAFELLDEQYVKFREPLGEAAKVILKKDNTAIYQKSVPITQNTVLFKFDKILPVGSYVLEIIVGDYVFPSNNRVIITVEQTYGDFEPEYLVKVSYEELKADVDDLKSKVTALEERPIVDTALTERVEALERKEDKDTVYDDTAIKKELSELNQSIAKKKLYYAYAYEKDGANGFTKSDVYDSFYREISNYFGISEKDSDNADDYFWMPTRVASDDELSRTIFEVNKLKALHRKAPTGYTLDRTTIPWTVRFDNGCELQFPKNSPTSERDKANLIYGYGFPANNNSAAAFSAPIPPLIISASRGTFTVDKFKESDEAHFHVTYADYRLYYPIRNSNDFNWENAYGDRVNQTVSTNGKSNFAKLMYELGIWSEADVLYLGATKK